MDSTLFSQSGFVHGFWNHHEKLKHHVGPESWHTPDLDSRARLAVLVAAAVVALATLVGSRIASRVPLFPPKDYRNFTVFNQKDYEILHGKEEADAMGSAGIEPLEGKRWAWAVAQTLFMTVLACVDASVLVLRIVERIAWEEEVVQLCFTLLLLSLFALRFYPTPYRHSLFLVVTVANVIPFVLLLERDVLPSILTHPTLSQALQVRARWTIFTRVAFLLAIQACTLFTPRYWYPVDPDAADIASPEQVASFVSYIASYSWIGFLVFKARHADLEPEDLPTLPDYDRVKLWSRKLEKSRSTTMFRTLLSLMRWDIFTMMTCSFALAVAQFIWPLSMRNLLGFVEKSRDPVVTPWVYVAGLLVGPWLVGVVWQGYIFCATRLIVRVKAALTQTLLEKTLKIRFTNDEPAASEKETEAKKDGKDAKENKDGPQANKSKVGMINNLMSTDIDQLTNAREFFLLVGSVPIEIVLAVVFLYDLLGWAALVGVALMIVTMIVPILLARLLTKIQRRVREASDARIGLMTETLTSVRIIKFFGMEKPFLERIRERRELELKLSLKSALYNTAMSTISRLLPIVNIVASFAIYTEIMGKPLTASVAFTSMSLFDMLRSQFGWMSFVSQQIVYAFVSFERIDKFLNGEEELEEVEKKDGEGAMKFENATLSWNKPDNSEGSDFRLEGLDVDFADKGLTVVAGPVGCGKSSLLLALLGEMRLLNGHVHLPRKHGVSYVSQSTWLQNDTVKNNILFGSAFDEKRFATVVEACGLSKDLENLEAGVETEIGERGTTLSGGQKARLSLARAVYAPSQIVLLDDILSALDAGTSKWIVEKCIKGEILKDRTVVLVTHHVSLVSSAASKIILMSSGKISTTTTQLSASELETLSPDVDTKNLLDADLIDDAQPLETHGPPHTAAAANASHDAKTSTSTGKLVQEEARKKGRVPISILWSYLKYFGPLWVLLVLVLLSTSDQLGSLANSFFVGLWSDQYAEHPDGDLNVTLWLSLYAALLVGTSLLEIVTYLGWYYVTWLASRRIHEKLVSSVLFSPIRFFDTTPVGRIINRLSIDIKSADSRLGSYFQGFFHQVLDAVFRLTVLSGLIPAFFVPTMVISIVGIFCGHLYVKAQMGVKRIVSVKESPLFSHFGDTISGIVTIRAFGAEERFKGESMRRIDEFSGPSESLYALNRWIGVRISWCNSVLGFSAGAIALTSRGYSPGLIGFSLANALAFSESILYSVRYYTILEVELNSFERVLEYSNLPQEPVSTPAMEPPAAWPTQGDVEVSNLSVRYSSDGPDVLNNISFSIRSRERVGIVGRTGSGKSSLALSLLRLTEISAGSIRINGRDVKEVNLEALRRRVTIIPQDPVLLSGTVRTNLDPFGEVEDTELQSALEGSGLVEANGAESSESGTTTPTVGEDGQVASRSVKKIGLDTPITAGGDNLSQGQRQLLAFARALVRRSKLAILDEATSSTDFSTDERVQLALRTGFPDSSLLVIAHRLRTVMSMDRIVVLENRGQGGEVVEWDTPITLLEKEGGVLHTLAKKSGEYEELLDIARKNASAHAQ